MKRTLSQLIRLTRQQLDEKRREQADLLRQVEAIDADRQALDAALESERQSGAADPVSGMAFAAYARAVADRRATMDRQREDISQQADGKAEEIRSLFEEVKRYEMMLEQREEEERQAEAKAEQAELDEIGLQRTVAKGRNPTN